MKDEKNMQNPFKAFFGNVDSGNFTKKKFYHYEPRSLPLNEVGDKNLEQQARTRGFVVLESSDSNI